MAGQAEIRLYLLGIDFCLVKAARVKGEEVGVVYKAQLPFRYSTHVPR